MSFNMTINNDLTCSEIVELRMSLTVNIEQMDKMLERSLEFGIKENVSYYSDRINRMKVLKDKLDNTYGAKAE